MGNLTEELLRSLKKHGAEEIFGIPGDYVVDLFKIAADSDILKLFTLSHEPALGFAADASARFNKRLSAICVTYGVGALNAVNSIAGAYAERLPIAVISGYPDYNSSDSRIRMHHQLKSSNAQMEIYKNITCAQVRVKNTQEAPFQIASALKSCLTNSRPVLIEIPEALYNAECATVPMLYSLDSFCKNDHTAAEVLNILNILKNSKNPLLLLGYELIRFNVEKEASELAEKLNIRTLTTLMSRNIKYFECYKGILGEQNYLKYLKEADTVFILGGILNDSNFSINLKELSNKNIIIAGDDTLQINNTVHTDIHIKDLLNNLNSSAFPVAPIKPDIYSEKYTGPTVNADSNITSYSIINAINSAFADFGELPIVCDIGESLIASIRIKAGNICAPWFYGSMGYGIPAGMGLQLSSGQRPLVLVGDGDFQMTGWELCNCSKYKIDPIIIVFNNSSWEILNAIKGDSKFNSITKLDYYSIADTLGGKGYRAETEKELENSLAEALRSRGSFQLIDACLSEKNKSKGILKELSNIIKGKGKWIFLRKSKTSQS